MSSSESSPPPAAAEPGLNAERIIDGVSEAVSLSLRIGASLARLAAQATAGDKAVPEPRRSDNPINAMVHYSIATVVNLLDNVAESVSDVRQAVPRARSAAQPAASQPGAEGMSGVPATPTVHRGTTLRIPLSIENPGVEPMVEMRFVCTAVRAAGVGEGPPLSPAAVRFEPELLTVAPKDFDKLTVYIDAPEEAAPGQYEVAFGLSDGSYETTIQFQVV